MTTKKNPKANLERNKSTFLLLGIAITLSFILISFEWSTEERKANAFLDNGRELIEQELIPNIIEPDPVPPVPPQIIFPEHLLIVNDSINITDSGDIFGGDIGIGDSILPISFVPRREPEILEPDIFISVQDMPRFLGGEVNKFSSWVNERVRYPQIPQENGIQGRVFLTFVIEPDGRLTHVEVLRSVDPHLDAEAIRVVQSSPKWTPGKQMDIPVRVRCSISINFVIK